MSLVSIHLPGDDNKRDPERENLAVLTIAAQTANVIHIRVTFIVVTRYDAFCNALSPSLPLPSLPPSILARSDLRFSCVALWARFQVPPASASVVGGLEKEGDDGGGEGVGRGASDLAAAVGLSSKLRRG